MQKIGYSQMNHISLLVFHSSKRVKYRNATNKVMKTRYDIRLISILLYTRNRVIKISISKIIKISPKIKNCNEKGGRLVKIFSIPHSNGRVLGKFLLFFSFKIMGSMMNTIPMIKVHLRVRSWVIMGLS